MPLGASYALRSELHSFTARRHFHPCSQLNGLTVSVPNTLLPRSLRLVRKGRALPETQLRKLCWDLLQALTWPKGAPRLTSVQSRGSELQAEPETKDWERTHLAERPRHKGAAA